MKSFKSAAELITIQNDVNIVLHHKKSLKPSEAHNRSYNLPQSSEVAALLSGETAGDRDIILSARDGTLKRISYYHRSYDPLQYVLLFPYGEDGWEIDMKRVDKCNTLTLKDFYSYRLQIRKDDHNTHMRGGRLTQIYAVDAWCKVESSRFHWVRTHQKEIRTDKYSGLLDAIAENDLQNAGLRIVLPPSIYCSPRFYLECYLDAMALVLYFGKPDYLFTLTTNPNWIEIRNSLLPGQKVKDRPDIAVRVFKIKLESLLDDFMNKNVIGKVKVLIYTIEWQKRGLTHAHILITMQDSDKPRTPEMIDKVVSAEIPDKIVNPKLYDIITSNNIHGPCGTTINSNNPCMEGEGNQKHCTKKFPKSFTNTTIVREDAYPQYRRRAPDQGGQTHKIRGKEFVIDNSWVVPYNPALSLRYDSHINVEIVDNLAAVKYLYKYITKGNDRIIVRFDSDGQPREDVVHDEIENFANVRFLSASEAYWKLYSFQVHYKNISVVKLPCHLENEQMVIIPEGVQPDLIMPPVTKLTAFFELNKGNDELAKKLLYVNIPKYFVWKPRTKEQPPYWKRRERGKTDENYEFTSDAIGRMTNITFNARQSELYYLRLLLLHQKGPTCHNDLKKVYNDGQEIICNTFQEACKQLGLLHDDKEISKAMQEVSLMTFGDSLRYFFCSLLIFCQPSDPLKFWNDWQTELCRDKMVQKGLTEPNRPIIEEVLLYIKRRLEKEELTMKMYNLPEPEISEIEAVEQERMIHEETNYNTESLRKIVQQQYQTLNEGQKKYLTKS